jgi:putative ABC transport system permease protein
MAIRAALGADARRLARQLIVENVLLGLVGGIGGLVAAWLLLRALPSLLPADFPRVHDIGIDLAVVAAALAASVVASTVVGLLPARRARRINLVDSLAEEGTSPSGGSVRTSMARTRALILTGQVAVACVLLVGASLLGRSFLALMRADVGFDPRNVLTARLQMPGFAYPPERRAEILDAVIGRLRAIPGVTAVSYADGPPLGIFGGTSFFVGDRQVNASSRTVTPGYLAAMGMRIVEGRDFTDEDVATSRPAFIVNRAFARQYLPASPAGTFVRGWVRKAAPRWEILGVVEDVRHRGPTEPGEPEIYVYREKDDRRISAAPTVIVRTAGDPLGLATTLRAVVRAQDASVVVDSVMTMEERLMMGLARPRLYAMLLGAFAGLALLIAGVGLFGLLSFTVAQRSRELALRTALGATRAAILRLVLLYGVGVAAAGIAVGLVASVGLRASISALLHGVTPADPLTYVVVPLLLLAVAVAACAVPAWRAARLDPLRVLKGA